MSSSEQSPEQPLVEDGDVQVPAGPVEDFFAALDDLMVFVEALCPVWPPRATFTGKEKMLL